MNNTTFSTQADLLLSTCLNLLKRKGKDYAQSSDDRLINFKQVGQTLGISPAMVLMVYVNKHLDSIVQAIQANPTCPQTYTEHLDERIQDVINYMVLLSALIKDMHSDAQQKAPGV